MWIKLLNKIGFWPTLALAVLIAVVVSMLLTKPVAALLGVPVGSRGVLIGMVISLVIAPYFGYFQFRLILQLDNTRKELAHLAATDSLTGVANRRQFFALAENITTTTPPDVPICLAVIDADNFKQINDTFGHLVGDDALRRMTAAAQAILEPEHVYARFGGDEFILLVQDISDEDFLSLVRQLLHATQQISFNTSHEPMYLSVTVGVVTSQGKPHALNEMIAQADQALLEAKRVGGNRYKVFTPFS